MLNVKTEYVKKKIRGKSFSDTHYRRYVKDMVRIEEILSGRGGLWSGYVLKDFREKHEEDYFGILEELHPGSRKREEQRSEEESEARKAVEEMRKIALEVQEQEELGEWLMLGGKP